MYKFTPLGARNGNTPILEITQGFDVAFDCKVLLYTGLNNDNLPYHMPG